MTTPDQIRRPKVLVVDDNEHMLRMLELTLPSEGIEVKTCPNAPEALGRKDIETYDVILLDLRMEPMTGMEFLENYSGKTPVAVMTGGKNEALEPFLKYPNFRCLVYKPKSLKPFIDAINHAMTKDSEPKIIEDGEIPDIDPRPKSPPPSR